MRDDRNVWSGGTPGVQATLAFVGVLMNRDGTHKVGVSMNDGVQAAVAEYDKAHTDNGWTRVHLTDPDQETIARIASELARMLGGTPDLYGGESRKLIAALGGAE